MSKMVKLKRVRPGTYRYNHPDLGFGLVREGDVFEVPEGYAETLLNEGEQVRPDLFVPSFEKVGEVEKVTATADAEPDLGEYARENTPEEEQNKAPRSRKTTPKTKTAAKKKPAAKE